MLPKRPQDHPEAFPRGRVHPGAPQETPRYAQKAFLRASGSVLGRLWTRLERHLGAVGISFKGAFEIKIKIDSESVEFQKYMVSPRREHRFEGLEGTKLEATWHPKCLREAKRAQEELQNA